MAKTQAAATTIQRALTVSPRDQARTATLTAPATATADQPAMRTIRKGTFDAAEDMRGRGGRRKTWTEGSPPASARMRRLVGLPHPSAIAHRRRHPRRPARPPTRMDPEPPRNAARTSRAAWGVGALLLWGALLGLALRLPPDGREHGDLGQFVGRFHPLVVHGPVAMLALVALMEVAGCVWRRRDIRTAAGWILALCAVAAFAAAFDGWLLAWSGGYRGRDVTRHMWGGVWLAGACAAALWARHGLSGSRRPAALYPLLLAAAIGLVVWTAHGGGSLSHGDDFLTARMPARLRALLGLQPPPARPAPPVPT